MKSANFVVLTKACAPDEQGQAFHAVVDLASNYNALVIGISQAERLKSRLTRATIM